MKNYVKPGSTLTFIAAATIASGAGLLLGDQGLFGVNSYNVVNGDVGEAAVEGVFQLPMASVTLDAFDKVYWDNTAKVVTNVTSGNTAIGYVIAAATSGTCQVKLAPST